MVESRPPWFAASARTGWFAAAPGSPASGHGPGPGKGSGAEGRALWLGLGTAAGTNEPDSPPSGNGSIRWFTFGRKPEPKKKEQPAAKEPAEPSKATLAEAAAVQRAQEETALLRRQTVCLK